MSLGDFALVSPQASEVAGNTQLDRTSAPPAHSLRLDRDDAQRGKFGNAACVIAQLFEKRSEEWVQIGDHEEITVSDGAVFRAVSPDDNS